MSLIGYDLSQYPLDKQYEDCRQYVCSMNWGKISNDIRTNGTVGIDVSDAINSFSHLELDPQYRLICYMAKGYHGIFGRVKAVKKTDHWNPPCDVGQEDHTHSFKKTLRLPENVFPPMEAVYNDGTGEGYFEAVLFSQFLQALPYTCFEQDRWPHILNTMPEKYEEKWECQVALADWSPRHSKHTITALCREFENGFGASDGKDRICLTQFDFCNNVNEYLFRSVLKTQRPADTQHIRDGKYSEMKKCCVFTQSSVLVAREKYGV